MRCALVCLFLVTVVLVTCVEGKKSFSTRRKNNGSSRRGQSNHQKPPPQPPATPHRTVDSNTNFLNSERAISGGHGAGASGSRQNTHYRPNPFDSSPSAPQMPKQTAPQTNGPIGFEKLNTDPRQKLASPSEIASAPSYGGAPGGSYSGKPSAPNGPPPAYPGHGNPSAGTHGGFDAPPAYPGRPANAPPVYSANNPHANNFGGYPQQNHYQQGGVPHQQSPYPQQQWVNQGQNSFGHPNSGGGFGNYPNQGYNQGFGSHPSGGFGGYGNSHMGGFGQSYPGYGGNPYGGSPFGHSNQYGGSPFSPSGGYGGFGGNSFGGFGGHGFGGNHYSPNNFGYSSNPGIFGSMFGGNKYSQYGYHKRSRFGGLPIPIPIPIPIPLGGFGMFGGRSHNHRVLDTFIKNQTVSNSDNTTNVYILNNSTVTPCTTDQFIYDSLNVTVMSCTAGNCTAIKVFTTTNNSGEVLTHSAGITMCLEDNTTYSSFADNVNPIVSDLHKYWMKVCKELVPVNATTADAPKANVTVKVTQVVLNETVVKDENRTSDVSTTPEPSTVQPPVESSTIKTPVEPTLSVQNSSESSNSSFCEVFNCSWIEMCLPSIEIVDRCATSDCPFTRTGYKPCIVIKMCKSPSTPISTFATLNTTLSKIDQFNNVKSANDIANLTLISYVPPVVPSICSQNATDPACQPLMSSSTPDLPPASPSVPQDLCAPGMTGEANTNTSCLPVQTTEEASSSEPPAVTTESSTTFLG